MMHRHVTLLAVLLGLASALALLPSSPASSATQLLPNLVALRASEIGVNWSGAAKELRFSTTSANLGDGPLELYGGQVTGDSQQVHQRIYNNDGTSSDRVAGSMTYHEAHGHIHFDDYADYVLESETAPGQSLRTGTKQTFCIIDTDRINHRLPGAPKKAVYTTCGSEQGMSVGWGDTYRYYLAGQSIDITGLPDGDYRLIIRIDPKGRLLETDESDNESMVRVRITGDSVTVLDSAGDKPGNGRGRPNQ
jgi:hypothetical protein